MSHGDKRSLCVVAGKQILIVDDEDSIADMIADALRDEGYTVEVAYDGRRGLEAAQRIQPALVLTDVMMPFMDGIKMAELVQREFGATSPSFVFMSAVDCRDQTQLYGQFLFKPFTLDILFDTVETLMNN
nr:response regulator [Herpetosiphon giganteus]